MPEASPTLTTHTSTLISLGRARRSTLRSGYRQSRCMSTSESTRARSSKQYESRGARRHKDHGSPLPRRICCSAKLSSSAGTATLGSKASTTTIPRLGMSSLTTPIGSQSGCSIPATVGAACSLARCSSRSPAPRTDGPSWHGASRPRSKRSGWRPIAGPSSSPLNPANTSARRLRS